MNRVILMGRLTRDPQTRYRQENASVSRYTLAVDRRFKREGEPDADFVACVAFGHAAEFAEKYLKQGSRIIVSGRIQTGRYTNREGVKVYTTDVIVEEQEFAEGKAAGGSGTESSRGVGKAGGAAAYVTTADGFMDIPDGIDDELPFS